MKGAGLVRSKRGVGGGYVLARPPEEITLADILAAVDGPLITADGRARPLRGPLRPAGGLGRRLRRDPPDPRALHPRRARRAHPRSATPTCSTRALRSAETVESWRGRGATRVAARSRTITSSPPDARRLERDVAAVADARARGRSPARGRSGRSGGRRAAPRPTARSGRTRAPAPRRSCPGPRRSRASSTQSPRVAAPRRAPRCPAGATSSALLSRLSTTCSRRPGVTRATGAPVDRRRRCCTCVSAANASHASQRPSSDLVDRHRRGRRRRLLGAREHEQPVDETRERAHLARARRRGPRRPAPCTSASRFSSRSRSAASGVRSWCDASATNAALRADELLEARRGRVERLGEHGQLRRAVAAPRRAPTGRRAPSEPAAAFEVGERLGHRTREQQAGQEHDAEHDAAGGREQQPDVRGCWSSITDAGYVMRTAPWMPAAEPIGSAT